MTTTAQVREAYKDYLGDKVSFARGWNTRGRPWPQNRCRGVVEHHTVGVGDGVLAYCLNKNPGFPDDGRYPYCNEYTRRNGHAVVLSALSAWHSGLGGPWPKYGVPRDLGHLYLWGREIESWGREKDFTDEMFETIALADAALADVFDWKGTEFNRIINHKGWTDGGPEMGLDYWLPTRGRKSDTLYNVERFRANAAKARKTNFPQVPAPEQPQPGPVMRVDLSDVVRAARKNGKHSDVSIVARGLKRVGIDEHAMDDVWGPRMTKDYRRWQRRLGYQGGDADGIPGMESLSILGRKSGLFKVVV